MTSALDLGAWERRVLAVCLLITGVVASSLSLPSAQLGSGPNVTLPWNDSAVRRSGGHVPLSFVPNRGQVDDRVRYHGQDGGASFWFTQKEAVFALSRSGQGAVLALRFLGSDPEASVVAVRPGIGTVNYLIGPHPSDWRTGLPMYGGVSYRGLWPGTDLRFRGGSGTLRYEFRLAPGADPSRIRLAYRGAASVSLDRAGNLVLGTPLGPITDARPVAYQVLGGRRIPVASRYTVSGRHFGFDLGPYDRARPLIIDPEVAYSTLLGGAGMEQGKAVAVDANGDAYVAGLTSSGDLPTSVGAYDPSLDGFEDAFVTKLNPDGSGVVYSTYLGGAGADEGYGVAVDGGGSVYVTGLTGSGDFPATAGASQSSLNGPVDAFVTKLNPAGSGVVYSTLLGGSDVDFANAIAVDSSGNAYLAGDSRSTDLPTTAGAFDTTFADGFDDAFAAKLSADGSTLVYATYLGGSFGDDAFGVAVDGSGRAHVAGFTTSEDYPTTDGAYDTFWNGRADAFVTKLNASGSDAVYSTFLGGNMRDEGFGISVDGSGNAYVAGETSSSDYPTTAGASDTSQNGGTDVFVTKLNPAGSDAAYSTFVGGGSDDQGRAVALGSGGTAYVTGTTFSANYPTTGDAHDISLGGASDAFLTEVDAAGSGLTYSTYVGGSGNETGSGVAPGAPGEAYVGGYTTSADYPTTAAAYDISLGGSADAFVTKFGSAGVIDPPPPAPSPESVTLSPGSGTDSVGGSHTVMATVADGSGEPLEDIAVRFSVTGSVTTSDQCTTDGAGRCSVTYEGPQLPGADAISAYADANENQAQDPGEPGGSASMTWVLPASTPGRAHAGGHLRTAEGHRITFAVLAASTGKASRGMCVVVDHTARRWVKCRSVTAFVLDGNEVTIYGNAVEGHVTSSYVIHLVDQGKPGRGRDTFSIDTGTGFSVSGTLAGGGVHCDKHGPRYVGGGR